MNDEARGPSAAASQRVTPLLEWVVAAIGAFLVAAVIAYLIYQSLWRDETPPDVRVTAERVLPLRQGYLVEFRAVNQGGQAAAQVTVDGELTGPEGVIETGEAILDYLPPDSERAGGLFFSRDPRAFELQLRAKGYTAP